MQEKLSIIDKITIWLLILSPVLQIYGAGSLSLSDFLTWIAIGLGVLRGKLNFKMPKRLIQYFIYLLLVSVFSNLGNSAELIGRSLGVIHVLLVFALFFSIRDVEYFYKSYKYFVLAAIGFFFLQEFSFATIGLRISGLIPFLPLNNTFSNFDNTFSFHEYLQLTSRSSSFFSEPAYFAQVILPFFPLSIYFEKDRKRFFFPLLVTFTLFVLQSGNGIVGLSVLLILYVIYYFKVLPIFSKIGLILFVLVFLTFGLTSILNSEIGQQYLGRTDEVLSVSGNADNSSGFVRIYLGYYVFNEYDFFEKILGLNNFSALQEKIMQTPYGLMLNGSLYFNTIQNYLLKAGIIGLLFFFLFLKDMYRGNNLCSRSIIILYTVLAFISNMYLSSIMLLYFVFVFRIKELNKSNNGYV